MHFISDALLEEILEEDIPYGDLTSELLGIEDAPGLLVCHAKSDVVLCGAEPAARLLERVGLAVNLTAQDGTRVAMGVPFLTARGSAGRIHAVVKTAQNLMEYCSGIATRTADMVDAARRGSIAAGAPSICRVVTTRKHFPGTKTLSLYAARKGGAQIHRTGLSESVLVFDQHRVFCPNFLERLSQMHSLDPERKIAVEVDSLEEAVSYAKAGADILQVERLTPEAFAATVRAVKAIAPTALLSATGGVRGDNAEAYARAGADFLVTTWPYFGKPADIKMKISAAK